METVDNSKRNNVIIKEAGISYEDEILPDDYIWVEIWDNGFGERGFFHLFDNKGNMKDIQVGKPVHLPRANNMRPKRESGATKGPKKRGGGKKKKAKTKTKKIVKKDNKKTVKKTKVVKKKAVKANTALQDRVAAFLAKKGKNNG